MDVPILNTSLEAYKLIHDPVRLLNLLYSKYGDIEEDYSLLILNQLVFNKLSHLNVVFKEKIILEDYDEYLKKGYKKNESKKKIPKLNEYYKNYLVYFCNPILIDFEFAKIIKILQDKKATIFYKYNYGESSLDKDESENESSSFSSIDNITNNKTIFDKKNKYIIDNNVDAKNITITLNSESFRKKIDKNMGNDDMNENSISFIHTIKNLVYYKKKMKNKEAPKIKFNPINKKDKKNINNTLKKLISNEKDKITQRKLNQFLEKNNNNNTINREKHINQNLLSKLNSLKSFTKKNRDKSSSYSHEIYHEKEKNKKTLTLFLSQNNIQNTKNKSSRLAQKSVKRNKSYNNNINNPYKEVFIINNNFKNKKKFSNRISSNRLVHDNVTHQNKETIIRNKKSFINNNTNFITFKSASQYLADFKQYMANKNNRKNIKANETFNLNLIDSKENNNKLFYQRNNIINNLKKMIKSTNSKKSLSTNFNLFKEAYSPLKKDKKSTLYKKPIYKYNKLRQKKSSSFDEYKKYIISSSTHKNSILYSLNPKAISKDNKKGINLKKSSSKLSLLKRVDSNLGSNNIINYPLRNSKNKINYSNSNYNINFTNLFFYGFNSSSNLVNELKSNLITNKNNFTQFNNKKNNNKSYIINFNNNHNSKNKSIYNMKKGTIKNLTNNIKNEINKKRIGNLNDKIFLSPRKVFGLGNILKSSTSKNK